MTTILAAVAPILQLNHGAELLFMDAVWASKAWHTCERHPFFPRSCSMSIEIFFSNTLIALKRQETRSFLQLGLIEYAEFCVTAYGDSLRQENGGNNSFSIEISFLQIHHF